MPDFRPCSTCGCRSQAPLRQCTPRVMSIHPEGTIGRLRYLLGGDRPSQTPRLARFRAPCRGSRLDAKPQKSGISPSPPPSLTVRFRWVPPILHICDPTPMPNWSKAPRGLFVLAGEMRIFTHTSISPGPSLRQRPDRYAIRAGRNLPDKEFRYLRTVIVTAAVHRGFGSKLAPLPLTFRHWAGVSPYTSPFGFAETYGFVNQSPGPFHCAPHQLPTRGGAPAGGPLLPKLRGEVAEFLNEGSPVHLGLCALPTCVGLRYGRSTHSRRGFS